MDEGKGVTTELSLWSYIQLSLLVTILLCHLSAINFIIVFIE